MKRTFLEHWPEYLIEAWALGTFMISACLFTALLEHPSLPLRHLIPNELVRRAGIGLAMGLTAVFLIYSPWGQRSGAHMNPAVTLAFWRLGKMSRADAFYYIVFQFLGGYGGVLLSIALLGKVIAHPSVAYAVTVPGLGGPVEAWWAEFVISFLLMVVVLIFIHSPKLASRTGLAAGALVAIYIFAEAPISGMSMNPARTLGSALPAHLYTSLWVYFTAPVLAMLAAAETYRRLEQSPARQALGACAKLIHNPNARCIFCGQAAQARYANAGSIPKFEIRSSL